VEKQMRLVILIGASGSGKTAIAQAIASERFPVTEVLCFDSIGVPPAEEMVAGWGSPEGWQRTKVFEWITRISGMHELDRPVLFEGQMRLAFLRDALASVGILGARIVLVDCDDATRMRRLTWERRQPELANPVMMSWAAHLRSEAREIDCEILDTTGVSLRSTVDRVRRYLQS
jgi:RNase adaptor protein for sRNA GlmZ degradation